MKEPDMLLATPLDAVFLLLPILSPPSTSNGNKQMFLAFDEYLDKFTATSKHEKHLIARMNLGKLLKARATSICDFVDAGDEKMYRISHEKLAQELLSKARRMCCSGLPASMEEHFVNSALRAPVSNVLDATPQDQANSDASQNVRTDIPSQVQIEASTDSQTSAGSVSGSSRNGDSQSTTGTGATSLSEIPQPLNQAVASEDARQLLRLRTALNFVLSSYVPQHLRKIVQTTMSESKLVEFSPLDEHLKHLETLRRKAQALRSLSDNITRKRGADDDDEAAEARAEKKRKKEEEEKKEKAETRAMKQLKKVDTKGMKKLSAFFTKAPAR